MGSATYGGLVREIPILPFPSTILSLVRGMVVQWNAGAVGPWLGGASVPFGVCTNDMDRDLGEINVYCARGASVQILCEPGIVPAPGDLLYSSATVGSVTNIASGVAFAKAVGPGMNGTIEAVII
jgi:hypothetical protein